jgi:hypothetical protein
MSLAGWQRDKWLVPHKASAQEIAALLAIVERDLANAKVAGLAEDWKFSIAYNAALQAATAALAAAGFRAAREQHHYRTVQSLALTIGRRLHRSRRQPHSALNRQSISSPRYTSGLLRRKVPPG